MTTIVLTTLIRIIILTIAAIALLYITPQLERRGLLVLVRRHDPAPTTIIGIRATTRTTITVDGRLEWKISQG